MLPHIVVGTHRAAWNDFVAAAGGSVLQSWQWGEFKRRQGWRVLRLMAVQESAPLAAQESAPLAAQESAPLAALQVLVRVVPGLGAFCYAAEGPVLAPDAWSGDGVVLGALLAETRRRGARCGALALRVDPLTSEPAAPQMLAALGLRRSRHDVQPAATAVVDLNRPEEQLWRGLARDARYRIRRARRDGVLLRPGSAADVEAFAAMLAATGRRKGFGVRDAAYLRPLVETLRAHDSGSFIVADVDGAIVGATLVATFGQRAASLYTASDEHGRTLGAQHLLHWEAMLQARRAGCALYDFRGVGAGNDPADAWAGLNFFKQRFGTRHEDLAGAWDHVYRPLAYRAFILAQDARRHGFRL